MYQCPINYFVDNLIFNADGSCWSAYRLHGFNYDYLSTQGKVNKLLQLARLFMGIMSEAQILIIPVEQDLKEHFDNLRKRIKENDILYNTAQQQIKLTEEYLQEKTKKAGLTNDYNTYIVIKLNKAAEYEAVEKLWDAVQYFFRDPINAINVQMNLDTKDILQSKIKAYQKMAKRWLDENEIKMAMEATTTEETQWLFRRLPYRGTGKSAKLFYKNLRKESWNPRYDEVDVEKEKIVRPYHRDVVNLFNGNISREDRRLKISTGFTTSYQTFLTLAHIPDVTEFPGNEWIYMLQKQNLQTEICIQLKLIPHKSALHRLDLKNREINSQIEHITEAKAKVPEDLLEAEEYAGYMEQELKVNKAPILETSVTICVADENPEELERKCSYIRELYDEINFVVERPLTDQFKLYMSFIPSVRNMMKDFVLPLTPMTLASSIVGVTRELGDRRGGFIGTTGGEEKPVFFAPELACLTNLSPAITLFGDLGTGKSFNANLLIYLLVLYGGYGLIIDPKGERSHWETAMVALRGLITIVTLGPDETDRGKLDPYIMYPDNMSEANELALNVLSDLLAIDPKSDENTILIESMQKINQFPGKNSMLKLVTVLEAVPEKDELHGIAQKLARKIRSQRENGMAGLLIGNGNEEAIRLENRLNIIQLQNLKMPDPTTSKEDYSREEILSGIIFGQVSAFVKKFALVKRPVPKGILIDESWFVSKSKQGRNMEEFISRMGRSLFTIIMYNGHSVTDLPTEGIKNSITYKFVFRCRNNKEEAERLLEYIGLEITPENMAIIQNLRSGQCLFKDMYNRVGVLQFDAVFQDIIDVFSTTPKEDEEDNYAEEELEEAIKADDEEQEEVYLPEINYEEDTEDPYTQDLYVEDAGGYVDDNDDFSLDIAFSEEDIFQKEQL